ncbi:MAG: ABC transporter permease [Candidatus Obscuribacter sp.]|jgi:peptide/nickel transport system permease protein|nr:ABC transporter permease [Candidatus Obscuribacter sp.]MBP6348292.1 ABC transporter permease [Candidatus Obscuribacter sp.]MBP6591867.1 ABC transporter permease [Candidatus Obscuribacter sp.]MDQ5964586.1 peptide/nickel transport system permease protein [Cyanobacteriota bacterium erpe_2018_sw_39hr_WHONDRS-SW48-000098_B_bin.30]
MAATATPQVTSTRVSQRTVIQGLLRDRVAFSALIVLAILYLSAAFADLLTPYSMEFNDPTYGNAPAAIIHWQDDQGRPAAPYVYQVRQENDPATFRQTFRELTEVKYPLKLLVHAESYKLLGLIPMDLHLFGVDAPARINLLGADMNGRDNFSRLFFGAQKSLTIGFLGLLIAFPIGIVYGGISGYLGGWADNLMMRFAEAVMSIPSLYLLIGLAAVLPLGMSSSERFALITVILSFISWPGLARVIRGMVLSIREEEFVQAAKSLGMPELQNIIKHVIPQTASYVIIAATMQVPSFILAESGLSLIGLGIQQPDASWGNMLKFAMDQPNELLAQPWLIAPGVLIFITILCYNCVGDVLRDVLDPKLAGGR